MTENKVIRLSPDGLEGVGLSFWGNCDAEDVTEGKPVETGHNYFTDATGQLTAGVWECTAYTSQIESYPVDEFCLILSGQVVITDATEKIAEAERVFTDDTDQRIIAQAAVEMIRRHYVCGTRGVCSRFEMVIPTPT